MNFMTCTTCTRVVQVNCTGICLSCQRGFLHEPGEDAFISNEHQTKKLKARLEEIEDALQKSETKSVDVHQQTRNGKGMGERNPKRKKASPQSKSKKKR